jgi:hypothetical protein
MGLIASGDASAAIPWLERARRIAREDDTVTFGLAAAYLAAGRPDARAPLEDLAARVRSPSESAERFFPMAG